MKRALMAASVIAMLAGTQALAQIVGVGPSEVVIEPKQRTLIKKYVVKEKVAPLRTEEKISIGAQLPADAELRSVPAAWGPQLVGYRYIYSDERVYLVEPSNRTLGSVIRGCKIARPDHP